MSWANNEAIAVMWFLLPGFVAAGLFRSLISNPKPGGLDSIAQVFIFTVLVQVVARLMWWKNEDGNTNLAVTGTAEILVLVAVAVGIGLIAAWVWNKDWLHRPLRWMNITRQSSYQSAQYSAFALHGDCYVVLHLKGQRRLFGWPQEWPSRPEDQHFLMEECEWLDDEGSRPITGVSHLLIPAAEVEMIEFLPMVTENETRSDT